MRGGWVGAKQVCSRSSTLIISGTNKHFKLQVKIQVTRMHSSRMRTTRALTVFPSMLCAGGRLVWGVYLLRGCLLWWKVGCLVGGACLVRGSACLVLGWGVWLILVGACLVREDGIPACTEADPPCEQNHTRLWKYNLAPTSLRAVKIQVRFRWDSVPAMWSNSEMETTSVDWIITHLCLFIYLRIVCVCVWWVVLMIYDVVVQFITNTGTIDSFYFW